MSMSESLRRPYLEIQVRQHLSKNRDKDLVSLIAGLLSEQKERMEFAAEMAENTFHLGCLLNVSDRTVFRQMEAYDIKLKKFGPVKNQQIKK